MIEQDKVIVIRWDGIDLYEQVRPAILRVNELISWFTLKGSIE